MEIRKLWYRTEKFASDNAPTILTTIGVIGVAATAYLTGKAAYESAEVLRDEARSRHGVVEDFSSREKVEMLWKLYIPAVSTGLATCACIVGANRIESKRAAALTAAYSISERAFHEYREKVVEQIGKTKEQKVRDAVAQDRVDRNPPSKGEVVKTEGGDSLFLEPYSSRYFWSDMETVNKAINELNKQMLIHDYVSLSDFYDKLGLSHTRNSDDLGWNSPNLLEVTFSTTISDTNKPCFVMNFTADPIRGYSKSHI
jgi:hypothetical protein